MAKDDYILKFIESNSFFSSIRPFEAEQRLAASSDESSKMCIHHSWTEDGLRDPHDHSTPAIRNTPVETDESEVGSDWMFVSKPSSEGFGFCHQS